MGARAALPYSARLGGAIVLFWLAAAALVPGLPGLDPYRIDLYHTLAAPSAAHWCGTDQLGRDVLARTLAGARAVLLVAPAAAFLATTAGTALGLLMGYYGGIFAGIAARLIDTMLALPLILVALLAIAMLGGGTLTLIAVIAAVFTPIVARSVNAAVAGERQLEYVAAAELRGEGVARILALEILPNILGPVIVEFTTRLGYAVFTAASLGFLGFGRQPPSPDWGLTVAENYALLAGGYWWPALFAALATASLVIGATLLADGLRGAP